MTEYELQTFVGCSAISATATTVSTVGFNHQSSVIISRNCKNAEIVLSHASIT